MSWTISQENKFSAFKKLIELHRETIDAYDAAIVRLENTHYQVIFSEFKSDHKRHMKEIIQLLNKYGERSPNEVLTRQWLTKLKLVIADIISDEAILAIMHNNEIDIQNAYENIFKNADFKNDFLIYGLQDTKKHKAWFEHMLDFKI